MPTQKRPLAAPRLRWMVPVSPGDLSPMERLISWLERNWEEYSVSTRKTGMLDQLYEEMAANGIYEVNVTSIRSQISHLKNGVQRKAECGECNSKDVNHYYDRLVQIFFSDDERAKMRERAEKRKRDANLKQERVVSHRAGTRSNVSRQATQIHSEGEIDDETGTGGEARPLPATDLQRVAPIGPILDTAEIQRRFELLSSRQELQNRGVDQELIDSFLPLRRE